MRYIKLEFRVRRLESQMRDLKNFGFVTFSGLIVYIAGKLL